MAFAPHEKVIAGAWLAPPGQGGSVSMHQTLSGHSFTVFSFVCWLVPSLARSLLLLHVWSRLACQCLWHHFYCRSRCLVSVFLVPLCSRRSSPGRYLAVSWTAVCSQIQNSHSFAFVVFVVRERLFWHWQVTVDSEFIVKTTTDWSMSHLMNGKLTDWSCNDPPPPVGAVWVPL